MILIISGTNRPNSNALTISQIIKNHYQSAGVEAEIYSLTEMPPEMFTGDAYAKKPESWLAVQQRVLDSDGLHIVTPEYNGSFPGVLKYFIDMLKFPESFDAKPVAFVGEAAGIWGGIRSVEQLQGVFGYRNAHMLPDRVFIPGIMGKLDADGKLTDAAIDERLKNQAVAFAAYVKHFTA